MPIYEYRCLSCGNEQENLVRGTVSPVCEHCGSQQLERRPSVFAVNESSSAPVAPRCCTGRKQGLCGGCAQD